MKLIDWAVQEGPVFLDIETRAVAMYADHPTTFGHGELFLWGWQHRADEQAIYADAQTLASTFPGFTLSASAQAHADELGDELAKALEAKYAGDQHKLAAIDIGGIIAAFKKWLPIIIQIWQSIKPKA